MRKSFSDLEYAAKKQLTRRDSRFLRMVDGVGADQRLRQRMVRVARGLGQSGHAPERLVLRRLMRLRPALFQIEVIDHRPTFGGIGGVQRRHGLAGPSVADQVECNADV